jgi:hypothetical protein
VWLLAGNEGERLERCLVTLVGAGIIASTWLNRWFTTWRKS